MKNLVKIKHQIGMTLIELVIVMVVLGIGLTGILSVMITLTRHSVDPALEWQAINIGDTILQTLMAKKGEIQEIKDASITASFPDLAKKLGNTANFTLSIHIEPIKADNDIQYNQIDVVVANQAVGQMHFTGLKTLDSHNNEKATRVYVY